MVQQRDVRHYINTHQYLRAESQDMTISYLLEMYKNGLVVPLEPEMEKDIEWKSKVIESLLLQIPLGTFYMLEDEQGCFTVVDGYQRLKAIFEFYEKKYTLTNLGLACNYEGNSIEDFPIKLANKLKKVSLYTNVFNSKVPKFMIDTISERLKY